MKTSIPNTEYGAFELKKIYKKNYFIGFIAAIIFHLIVIALYIIIKPEGQYEPENGIKIRILKYAELGPPPSIIRNEPQTEKINAPKPNFGKPVAAKKGEAVSEFEVPKETGTQGDVKVEPPKAEVKKEVVDETYYVAVDMMPEPSGGIEAIQKKIVYPPIARRDKVEGKVIIKAFIDESGSVRRAEVIKGIGSGCDEAAIAAVMNSRFRPGRMKGKVVKVQLTISLVFKL
ncbi:MAG: TonB family protein [Ignavibacteriales bacterium]|nr:TonB family protein [Ignavibacteriales bacterium]